LLNAGRILVFVMMSLPSAGFEPSALRDFRLFESYDLEETCDRMSAVLRPHSVRREAQVIQARASMDMVRFASTTISAIDYGTAVRVSAGSRSDYYAVIFCVRGAASVLVDGEEVLIQPSNALVTRPGSHIEARFGQDCEQMHIRIEAKALRAHTGLQTVEFRNNLNLQQPSMRAWAEQIRALVTSQPLLRSTQDHPTAATSMEHLLIELLMAGHPYCDPAEKRQRSIAPGCVRKAEAFMKQKVAEPITLGDVAAAAGVPPRTLHQSFRRFRESTPMRYLTELRLERARKLLLSPGNGKQVIDIALECGFVHLGRFAGSYRRAFGENPSETLRRAAHR
jgi:AraC-like DNA-binding protein